jgi:hypothetical protein
MDVRFFLKVPRHSRVRSAAGSWRPSAKDTDLWTATGELRGARLLACEWRTYNEGALVEQRIEEPGQLAVGRTAVDDIGGNMLLWAPGALAYQLLHIVRTTAPGGSLRRVQPDRLRTWLALLPGQDHAARAQDIRSARPGRAAAKAAACGTAKSDRAATPGRCVADPESVVQKAGLTRRPLWNSAHHRRTQRFSVQHP